MRTVRCSCRLLGGVCPGGVSACWSRCLPARGLSACQGVSAQGGCLPARGCTSPPSCGQTDTCENITFTQLLLLTVKINTIFSFENTARYIVFQQILDWQSHFLRYFYDLSRFDNSRQNSNNVQKITFCCININNVLRKNHTYTETETSQPQKILLI